MKHFVRLTKNEMKMVVGGLADTTIGEEGGDNGSCQEHKTVCTTQGKLNCCSGMICADYRCAYQTVA